ncbi:MAG TPA: glycerol-3-phosphate acyltransferase, partial [Methanomassiliicoccales archaeon]|nr:glycerol-3-phosphate acyltransferase [Methanomassiliicoccales archaeon]
RVKLGRNAKALIVIISLSFLILIADTDTERYGPILTYFYGSIPFGWFFAKVRSGKDISKEGSTNLGVANSFNVAGYVEGVFTIFTEASKAVIPLAIAFIYFDHDLELSCVLIAGSYLGTNFSAFMRLEGGSRGDHSPLVHAHPLPIHVRGHLAVDVCHLKEHKRHLSGLAPQFCHRAISGPDHGWAVAIAHFGFIHRPHLPPQISKVDG